MMYQYCLEKEMATHSSVLAWEIPRKEEPGGLHTDHGVAKSQTQLSFLTCDRCIHKMLTLGKLDTEYKNPLDVILKLSCKSRTFANRKNYLKNEL